MAEALGAELALKFRPWPTLPGCPACPHSPSYLLLTVATGSGVTRSLYHLLAGAVLLDLDQQTLPGVAHQVVEQMVISDQIKAEDRANVLRALLLKHRYGLQARRTQSHPACLALAPMWSFLMLSVLCLLATQVTRKSSPSPETSQRAL